jgi:uroporphyrinogen decarboxylase
MNSRERVLTALRHQEPDRIPLDLGSSRATTIHGIAYNRLKKHLGITTGSTKIYDIWQQIALVEDDLVRRFEIDVVPLNLMRVHFGLSNAAWKPYTLPDGSAAMISSEFDAKTEADGTRTLYDDQGHALARLPANGYWFDHTYHALALAESKADVDRYNWEGALLRDDEIAYVANAGKDLFEKTDYAINGHFGGSFFEWFQVMRGYSQSMMDLAINRELAEYILDHFLEVHLENIKRYLDAVKGYIQVIYVADDLGTQTGLWMSRDMYRDIFKPRHMKLYRYIKDHSDCFIFMHSCGAISEMIPDLIDVGVDIISPVQTSAAGMDPRKLKREFGSRMTFWGGGLDTQKVLQNGTPEEVRRDVKKNISIFAPGGGFVFNQIHNIQPDVPVENILAMFDSFTSSREY